MGFLYDEGGVQLFAEDGVTPLYDEGGPDNPGSDVPAPDIPTVDWTWVLGYAAPLTTEIRELTGAYGRSITARLDGPWTAQFTIDGRSEEAAAITALATDLHVYRDGIKVFRGRICTESDAVDETRHVTSFTAKDYRGMLGHRRIGVDGLTFVGEDQAEIAWQLVRYTQLLANGNWGITNGVGSTSGTNRDRTYDPLKPILDAMTELGNVEGGFEWEIDANLALNRWFPYRGVQSPDIRLDYGGRVTAFTRLLQPNDFGNYALASGAESTSPTFAVGAGLTTDPRGRWEVATSNPSIIEQNTLQGKANWLRDQAQVLRPEIAVTLAPGRWGGMTDIGLGDQVRMGLQSGRLAELTTERVVEITMVPGDSGGETIRMGLVAV